MTQSCALKPRAEQDLEEIWDYTVRRWGVDQAETYIRSLWRDFGLIAADPHSGRSCPEIREGYWKRTCGSHVVFYRITDTGIEIGRVLHKRMDLHRHVY